MTDILESVRHADNLPTCPAVAMEVLRLIRQDDVSVAELARVIQNDPALTSKILKTVNSSLFGMPRKISSVQQAMVVLGLRTVKVMALSFTLVDSMRELRDGTFDLQGYWRHSLTTAVAARFLAETTHPVLADHAFVAGLLADIGVLAALHCAPAQYRPVIRARGTRPLQFVEQEMLALTHAAISEMLLQIWNLPEPVVHAVGAHHNTDTQAPEGSDRELVAILRSAAAIADLFCEDLTEVNIEETKACVRDWTGLDEQAVEAQLHSLNERVREAAALFSLDIGETRDYAQLQTEAMTQLAHLTMTAELERALATQQMEKLNHETQALRQRVATDGLTQIDNRASFDEHLRQYLQQAAQSRTPVGLIMLDLDHFKMLNDTYGHQIGDVVLREVGKCLQQIRDNLRFCARYGGEEFAILVGKATTGRLRKLAEDVRQSIEQIRVQVESEAITVTASLGAAILATPGEDPHGDALVQLADECLYTAKRTGRNRVVLAS
ncbi:MAG: GGDEF domain-containing protein [Phycisphaerae bacterium]|nr:GGDEF domain-containing protein [Phycisphaerae bacterium]